jgi:hypothetical protein
LAELTEKQPLAAHKKDKETKKDKGDKTDKEDKQDENNDQEKQGCTALKIAANNNQQLIVQTDKKAQILVQVNALMISVLLTFALNIPEKHRLIILPIVEQMTISLAVIVISLAVTRPKRGGVLQKTSYYSGADNNLLFYGTYTGMEQEEYVQEMEYMFDDSGQIFQNLIQESFHQARMLGKKYKYLSWAYLVFSVGTGIAIITSIVVAFI